MHNKMKTQKKGSIWKKLLIGLAIVMMVLVVGLAAFSVFTYQENISGRQESFAPLMLEVKDYDGLQRTEMPFSSNEEQKLMGYLYQKGKNQKGVIVLAHGYGDGGHNSYMDLADYFASNGYYVFTYDATGTDESEGEGVGGFPQGAIDLDYAIRFVKTQDQLKDLPLMLFGHSWGGYSAGNVLNFQPDVQAVITVAAFNQSSDIFEVVGRQEAGDGIEVMMPFVNLYERIKFGDYATKTALEGFGNTDAKIMIVQSQDDEVVPMAYGYDSFYEQYGEDNRFEFVLYEDRGHNHLFRDETYINEFVDGMNTYVNSFSFNYDEVGEALRDEAKTSYVLTHLDREKWSHSLDESVVSKFVEFYDSAL
ncbi:hypothetical protein HMPREF2811_09610 [Globicatella sp. HMSC072A10]|uniref:alpha/beta hydrolase n=1 Tax=Globicatella sp. HMSC072A10 TaxID=1739315 RepID=UPI0008B3D40F|nr:alpha/beta fold hydrolase [Globicatella sp. HMSC072A10]OFK63180.1 hypothetical protein HMPREF2811_09610 [Globicatella sp. HMSC072A10]